MTRRIRTVLESQIIIYKDYMDPVCMSGETCNQELAADRIRGLTVHTGSGLCAGRRETESLGINRCGHISGALHGTVDVLTYLVHTYDE